MSEKRPVGRPRKIESPEKLKEYFVAYEKETKSNPFLVKDWVGKDADQVYREKERPLTMEGFEIWLSNNGIVEDLGGYMANSNGSYSEFSTICTHIKKAIRKDQIEGGMSGMYNPSITQRLNNLKEEVSHSGEITNKVVRVSIKKNDE